MAKTFLKQKGNYRDLIAFQKAVKTRAICSRRNDSAYYREAIRQRSDETICNIAITLIHQAHLLLRKYIEKLQEDFLTNGGIHEQMHAARLLRRNQ